MGTRMDGKNTELIDTLGRALNGKSRYKLAFESALAVLGFDAVQIDELVRLAHDCQFEELNRRMTDRANNLREVLETTRGDLSSAHFLITKHLPGHNWLSGLKRGIAKIDAALFKEPNPGYSPDPSNNTGRPHKPPPKHP